MMGTFLRRLPSYDELSQGAECKRSQSSLPHNPKENFLSEHDTHILQMQCLVLRGICFTDFDSPFIIIETPFCGQKYSWQPGTARARGWAALVVME